MDATADPTSALPHRYKELSRGELKPLQHFTRGKCTASGLHLMDPPSTTTNNAPLIAYLTSSAIGNYCNTSALALLVYDYILLLDKEIELFWKRKVTGASLLFLFNRYLPIIAYIIRPAKMIPMSCSPCSTSIISITSQTLTFSQYLPWAAFSALRAFALCKRPYNWPIAALVFTLSCVSIVTNFVRFYWIAPAKPMFEDSDCILYEVQVPSNIEAYLGARACLIAADTIVLCVTWRATSYKFPWPMGSSIYGIANKRDTFSNILLRDGKILVIMNVLYLTLTMIPSQINKSSHVSFVVQLYEPVTAVLTSRFLLDLHEVNYQLGNSQSAQALSSVPPERSVAFAQRAVVSRWSFDSSFLPLWDQSSINGTKTENCQDDEEE
ncbi:hypothetical protein V8D89_015567 [Ganoderma adspersum]